LSLPGKRIPVVLVARRRQFERCLDSSGGRTNRRPFICVHTDAQCREGRFGKGQECDMETTKVGIREFRSGLAEYIDSETPVAVTRHGQTVGFFIPTHGQVDADVAALKRASAELDRLLAAQSVDIEAVVTEFKAIRRTSKAAGPRKRAMRKPA
jgi:hypothetical protein